MGNSLEQYRIVIGMHCNYLKARESRKCFKGRFWSCLVLLFCMEAIYLPVLKTLVHRFELIKSIACGLPKYIFTHFTFLI